MTQPPKTIIRLNSCASTTLTLPGSSETVIAGVWRNGSTGRAVISLVPLGPHATARVYLTILGTASDTFHFDIIADQSIPDTSVAIYVRSMLAGRATLDSCGIMRIQKNAVRSHSTFSHHVLLASQDAHAKVTPTLEIETDDVTAGHAVGIGTLDPDMLFYCASRGLAARIATDMIARGFLLADCIKKKEESVRTLLEPIMNEQFPQVTLV